MRSFPLLLLLLLLLLLGSPSLTLGAETPLSFDDVIKQKHVETLSYLGESLVYVTPWNSHGYDIAKQHSSRFSFVSPVWFNLQPAKTKTKFKLSGDHNVDAGWVAEVRANGGPNPPKIVPRFSADGFQQTDYSNLLTNAATGKAVARLIAAEVKKFGFDGMALEIQGAEKYLQDFIAFLHAELDPSGLIIILVIPPYRGTSSLGKEDLSILSRHVHRFSLMTYDYSNPNKPGPNSPIGWVRSSVEHLTKGLGAGIRAKILVGLNFYGNDFILPAGGGTILGDQYLELLAAQKPVLEWNPKDEEHVFRYTANGQTHAVYYPTIKSIARRLALAQELGVGISVWEIGQGLDYWYTLFGVHQ